MCLKLKINTDDLVTSIKHAISLQKETSENKVKNKLLNRRKKMKYIKNVNYKKQCGLRQSWGNLQPVEGIDINQRYKVHICHDEGGKTLAQVKASSCLKENIYVQNL